MVGLLICFQSNKFEIIAVKIILESSDVNTKSIFVFINVISKLNNITEGEEKLFKCPNIPKRHLAVFTHVWSL